MKTGTLLIAALLVASPLLYAGEDIAVTDLPSEVTSAIEAKFPGAKLIKAEKETKRGELRYEVKIESGAERHEIDLTASGEILKIEKKRK